MSFASFAAPTPRGRQFVGAYQTVSDQSIVDQASSHRLITLLFEGLFAAIHKARGAMRAGDVQAKGAAIGQAVRIIDEFLQGNANASSSALSA